MIIDLSKEFGTPTYVNSDKVVSVTAHINEVRLHLDTKTLLIYVENMEEGKKIAETIAKKMNVIEI